MSTARIDNVGPSAGGTTRKLVRGTAAAWANLNGTGTIALRDSENVSSVVDIGVGTYDFNFTSAMATAGYVTGATNITYVTTTLYLSGASLDTATHTTSKTRSYAWRGGIGAVDESTVSMRIHGDLA